MNILYIWNLNETKMYINQGFLLTKVLYLVSCSLSNTEDVYCEGVVGRKRDERRERSKKLYFGFIVDL